MARQPFSLPDVESAPALRCHYFYAVAEGLPRRWRPPSAGVADQPVEARAVQDLVLVSTPVPAQPGATPAALLRHQEVIDSLLGAEALLPLRFGALVVSERPERWALGRLPVLRAALGSVRGCVEMTVRLLWLDGLDGPGAAAERLNGLARRLAEQAGPYPWRHQSSGRRLNPLASLAFLVPREEVSTFLARIVPVAARARGVAVVPGGPWPPYSFVPRLEAAAGTAGPPGVASVPARAS